MEIPTQKRKTSPKAAAAGYKVMARVAEKEAWRLRKRAHKPWLGEVRPVDPTRIERARRRGLRYLQLDELFADNPNVKSPDRQRVLGAAALLLAVGGENVKAAEAIEQLVVLEEQSSGGKPVLPSPPVAEDRLQELLDIANAINPL